MTQGEVWQLVLSSEWLLRRELKKLLPHSRRTREQMDEMYSDVVLARAHRIMELYDPSKGKPLRYLVVSCKWYGYKWVHGRNGSWTEPRKRHSLKVVQELEQPSNSDLDKQLRVSFLLDEIGEDKARLLRWYYMEEFTFVEIGEYLGVSAVVAGRMCRDALQEVWDRLATRKTGDGRTLEP